MPRRVNQELIVGVAMPLPQSVYQDPFGDLSFTRAAISNRIHQRQELIGPDLEAPPAEPSYIKVQARFREYLPPAMARPGEGHSTMRSHS